MKHPNLGLKTQSNKDCLQAQRYSEEYPLYEVSEATVSECAKLNIEFKP